MTSVINPPWLDFPKNMTMDKSFIDQIEKWYPFLISNADRNARTNNNLRALNCCGNYYHDEDLPLNRDQLYHNLQSVSYLVSIEIRIEITQWQFHALISWIFDNGSMEFDEAGIASQINAGRIRTAIRLMRSAVYRDNQADLERFARRLTEYHWMIAQ